MGQAKIHGHCTVHNN